jgi:hypothetical protein
VGGIPCIFFTGCMLHFLYRWTGFWPPVAWLTAVNDSLWEHGKPAFWPALAWW